MGDQDSEKRSPTQRKGRGLPVPARHAIVAVPAAALVLIAGAKLAELIWPATRIPKEVVIQEPSPGPKPEDPIPNLAERHADGLRIRNSLTDLIGEEVNTIILVNELVGVDDTGLRFIADTLKDAATRRSTGASPVPWERFHVTKVDVFAFRVEVRDLKTDLEYIIDLRKGAAAAAVICVADYVSGMIEALCQPVDDGLHHTTGSESGPILEADLLVATGDAIHHAIAYGQRAGTRITSSLCQPSSFTFLAALRPSLASC